MCILLSPRLHKIMPLDTGDLKLWFLNDLVLGERNTCVETSKVRRFKDMKKFKSSIGKNDISMIQLCQFFSFFICSVIFFFLWGSGRGAGIEEKFPGVPYHIFINSSTCTFKYILSNSILFSGRDQARLIVTHIRKVKRVHKLGQYLEVYKFLCLYLHWVETYTGYCSKMSRCLH